LIYDDSAPLTLTIKRVVISHGVGGKKENSEG